MEKHVNKYYLDLYKKDEQIQISQYFFPNLNLQEEADATVQILKIIPNCVEEEWISIFQQIVSYQDKILVLKLMTNGLLLLAQIAQSQKESINVLAAMKHYLSCYSAVIKVKIKKLIAR